MTISRTRRMRAGKALVAALAFGLAGAVCVQAAPAPVPSATPSQTVATPVQYWGDHGGWGHHRHHGHHDGYGHRRHHGWGHHHGRGHHRDWEGRRHHHHHRGYDRYDY